MATALAMPLLMCAGGIYAAGDTWWRRRRGTSPDRAAQRAVAVAEAMVADEYALLVADGEGAERRAVLMRRPEQS
ncbi:hypothetical protein ACIRF8_07945 [Streptomyces sp. NPDC102406]|uniref:hypothetical protein n=1 Tax=Streptomyces sp. NPDC102406 TaxID=3366171 RepID=UPI00380428BD